jgi:uncharacterized protein
MRALLLMSTRMFPSMMLCTSMVCASMLTLWMLSPAALAVTDCSRARTNVEKMLCSSQRAAEADNRLALSFRGAFARTADRRTLLDEQQRWQESIRDQCPDISCLLKAYQDRMADLDEVTR